MGGRAGVVKRRRGYGGWLILWVHPIPDGADAAAAPDGVVCARRTDRPVPRYGVHGWRSPAALSRFRPQANAAAATPAPVGAAGVGRGSESGGAGSGGPGQLEPPPARGLVPAMRGSG